MTELAMVISDTIQSKHHQTCSYIACIQVYLCSRFQSPFETDIHIIIYQGFNMYITSHIMNNSPSARYIFGTILGGGVKD